MNLENIANVLCDGICEKKRKQTQFRYKGHDSINSLCSLIVCLLGGFEDGRVKLLVLRQHMLCSVTRNGIKDPSTERNIYINTFFIQGSL